MDSSPAQRLFSRRTRTRLPTATSLLTPEVPRDTLEKLQGRKAKQDFYFNLGTKELPELQVGDTVRIKPLQPANVHKPWVKAKVQHKSDICSYKVRTEEGRQYCRNRRHLVSMREPASEPLTPTSDSIPASGHNLRDKPSFTEPATLTDNQKAPTMPLPEVPEVHQGHYQTRSGRVSKPPSYLKDYAT